MEIHLVDGTYELFRYYFGAPSHRNARGDEVAATRGVATSMVQLLEDGATHIGIATDTVIESFRNTLYDGYKSGEGVEPDILSQFPLLEATLRALGFVVWPMREHEADDGLASAARFAAAIPAVSRVLICSPDKDLAQCVGGKIVQFDRRRERIYDTQAVIEKFGVAPHAIADYLALVGDSADGFPGLEGFGAKTAATLLARYQSISAIPASADEWDVKVRGAAKLAATLAASHDDAMLFKELATLVDDLAIMQDIDDLRWRGPTDDLAEMLDVLDAQRLAPRIAALVAGVS